MAKIKRKAQRLTNLPSIPDKRYFSIGETSALCGVESHVLRYWEQEFTQLRPMKRRGNRRYYQEKDIQVIRRLCHLLYERGFTIEGARNELGTQQQRPYDASLNAQALPVDSLQSLIGELESLLQILN
ncbi:MAG: MerR family transcriptional regulator [Gammaproteobacteria bacterium]